MRLLIGAIALVCAGAAQADELRPGYLELTQRDTQHWRVVYKAPIVSGLATRARPVFPAFCAVSPGAVRLERGALVSLGELTCAKPLDGAQIGLRGIEGGIR